MELTATYVAQKREADEYLSEMRKHGITVTVKDMKVKHPKIGEPTHMAYSHGRICESAHGDSEEDAIIHLHTKVMFNIRLEEMNSNGN